MSKFQFRFEAVEKIRKDKELKALKILSDMQRSYQKEKESKKNLEKKLNASLTRRENLGKPATTITPFFVENALIAGLKVWIKQTEIRIKKAEKRMNSALFIYLNARRELKAITTLREKELKEFKQMMNKKERKMQDDISVMRSRFKREVA